MESLQFIKKIGQGNYGDVRFLKCSKTRKKYVLERIDLHRASKREQRAAYLEAKLLSTLKHPNIVTYLDSFYNSKGNLFIVMGYCEHGDLYSYMKNRNAYFEEKEIINWFVQICMGLKYLHDKGILHRDLKTQNIFLTRNKIVKIGEIGIAQALKAATHVFRIPYYMNPDVFNGKVYNQKTDVWALGCCMYEIAALEPAYIAQDMHSFIQNVIKGKFQASSFPAIYSLEFFNIISSMLSPDPDKRPNVTELLLNEFVRKFIMLSFKESPAMLNSSSRNCSRSTPSLAVSHRPLSRLFVSSDNNSTEIYKSKENLTNTTKIRYVPDSNGNGDGNDNSQHHANHIPVLSANKNSESKMPLQNSNEKVSPRQQIFDHYHCNLRESNQSGVVSVSSSSSSRSTPNSNSQRLRNEKSFTLLNNLCYTIRQSRLQNCQSINNVLFPDLPKANNSYGYSPPKSAEELHFHSDGKSKISNYQSINNGCFPDLPEAKNYHDYSPPKSADELYFHSDRKELLKRCSLSAFEIHSHKRLENTGKLPQIPTDKLRMSALSMLDKDKINLPILENYILSSQNDDKAIPCSTKDEHFDKLLIQNIMEYNRE